MRHSVLALSLVLAAVVHCGDRSSRGRVDAPRNQTEHRSVTVPKQDIARILERRTPSLMAIEGVVGTGEGREGADRVIIVLVARKTPALTARIPQDLDGWRVVIREVGKVTAPPP